MKIDDDILIDKDLEMQEKLEDIFYNIQERIDDYNSILDADTKKRKFKKKMKDPLFKLTQKIYDEYIKLKRKVQKIETTTESIKEDTSCILIDISEIASMIESAIDDIENIEDYMKLYLGSDWQKIKYCWQKYKDGEISKSEFVKYSLKAVGLRFLNIFVRTKR